MSAIGGHHEWVPPTDCVLFDVNGTLTDPGAIGAPWADAEVGNAVLAAAVETAMVQALLGTGDRPFSEHLRAALRVLIAERGLDPGGIDEALSQAAALPARPQAAAALQRLTGSGMGVVALTNSGGEAGMATLRAAGLEEHFDRVLGVDAVGTFKPHPRVYQYALSELGMEREQVVLVATHPWDLAGAAHCGMATAWVTHGPRTWPEVFPAPAFRGESLMEVAELVLARRGQNQQRPPSDRPLSDRPTSDRPTSDRPPSDRPPSDRPPSDRPPLSG